MANVSTSVFPSLFHPLYGYRIRAQTFIKCRLRFISGQCFGNLSAWMTDKINVKVIFPAFCFAGVTQTHHRHAMARQRFDQFNTDPAFFGAARICFFFCPQGLGNPDLFLRVRRSALVVCIVPECRPRLFAVHTSSPLNHRDTGDGIGLPAPCARLVRLTTPVLLAMFDSNVSASRSTAPMPADARRW